jgi:hypothetical protein
MATITTLKAGNWSDPSVWNGGVLPGVNDYAQAGHAVVIDQDITVLGLIISTTASFTVSGNTTRTINLTGETGMDTTTVINSTMLIITNTGTTNVTTSFGYRSTQNMQWISCNSIGGTINLTITSGWNSGNGGVTSYAVLSTTSSQNQTINITGSIPSSANSKSCLALQGTNNTVNLNGDITTSSTLSTTSILFFAGSNNTLNYTGTITTNLSPLINTALSALTVNLNGIINGGTTVNNTVLSTGTPIFKVSGIINSYNNVNPIFVKKIRIDSALDTTWTYNTDVVGVNKTLYTSGTAQGQPVINNVRSGTVYGANSEYTGTLIMATPANVRKGVPTDATVGTADLTVNDFWDKLTSELTTSGSVGKLLTDNVDTQISTRATDSGVISELNTSSTDVAVRMRNVSTVGITGQQLAGQG